MVANNAFVLKDMRDKSKAEGRAEGIVEGIELAKKVFKLFVSGETTESISKTCKIFEEEVRKILE